MQAAPRFPALDVLRGIAILGTLAVNIWLFTAPSSLLDYLAGAVSMLDVALGERLLQQLPNGKFLGLLSLLFGVGMALQLRQARATHAPWYGPYAWRMLLLLADGTVHFLLVFEFDILMTYSVTALLVAALLPRSTAWQRGWLWTAALLHGLLLLASALLLAAFPPAAPDTAALFPVDPYLHGSWWDLVRLRAEHALAFRYEAIFALPLTLALFLGGARLVEAGLLEPRGAALRRRLCTIAAVALPVDLVLGVSGGDAGLLLARYGTAPLVALGLLAWGVGAFDPVAPRVHGALVRRLAAVGRMALSAYVLQNLLASAVCYGWGLGLAAWLQDHEGARVPATLLLYLALCATLLLAAPWWLQRFGQGPLEALMRRLRPAARPATGQPPRRSR